MTAQTQTPNTMSQILLDSMELKKEVIRQWIYAHAEHCFDRPSEAERSDGAV
jgi:hypothetical protein